MNLRGLTQTSDLGLRFATQDVCARPSTFSPRNANQIMTVGIYQIDIDAKMHQLDTSAKTLDRDIQANVGDPVWREAWDGWYANWKAYYAETQKILNKLFSNPLRTKEIDDQVESYREQLLGWYADYRRQRGRDGRTPVPPPSGQPPIKGEESGDGKSSAGLPWWFWMFGGVALVGVSYIVYRKVQEGRAKAAFIHKRAPGLLEKYLPSQGKEAYEYSQAGRDTDPNFAMAQGRVGRDRDRPRRDTRYVHEDRDYVLAESDMGRARSDYAMGYASDPDPRAGRDRDEMLFEESPKRIPPAHPRQDYDRNYARSEDDYGYSPFGRSRYDRDVDYDFDSDEDY